MISEHNSGDSVVVSSVEKVRGDVQDDLDEVQDEWTTETKEESNGWATTTGSPGLLSRRESEFVAGLEWYNYQSKSNIDATMEDIVISLDVPRPLSGPITVEEFRRIILTHKVPVTTCLVSVMGLPNSGKTKVVEEVLRLNIKLKDTASWSFNDYMSRKRNKRCLSLYELCILGGSPHSQYAWSFATKRYGSIYSILSCIVRASMCFEGVRFEKPQGTAARYTSLLEEHIQWLIEYTEHYLGKLINDDDKTKLTLLQDGLSLINIMDIGVNKALYDFLPIMMNFCHSQVRLAFLSTERDCSNLQSPPDLPSSKYGDRKDDIVVMKRRSRLTYFLHFGTLCCRENKECRNNTVVIAVKGIQNETNPSSLQDTHSTIETAKEVIYKQAKSQGIEDFFTNWIEVDLNDRESLKALGEKIQYLIKNSFRYQKHLPLRWIILRSLVVSLSRQGMVPIIIHRKDIVTIAAGLDMNDGEVEEFLATFTDFGSILYIPQFDGMKHLVIVDIFQFTQYLDKLFYPDASSAHYADHLMKYGIISKASTKELLGTNEKEFMQIITTFSMAAQVTNGNPVLLPDGTSLFNKEDYYHLPSAKVGPALNIPENADQNDYAFLEIRSVNFPANVQACISHGIMKSNNVFMIATGENNISCFEFRPEGGPVIGIEMIYEGGRTRLRFTNNTNDILTSPATVRACSHVLIACCNCLSRKINLIRNLRYNVGIPCCVVKGISHFIYSDDQSDVCDTCKINEFRKCWIEAAKMMNTLLDEVDPQHEKNRNTLTKAGNARLEQVTLTPEDIFHIGKLLAAQDFDVETLCEALNVSVDAQEKECEKTRLAMTLIMKWERSINGKAYKNTLVQLLSTKFPEIPQMLQNPNNTFVY